MPSSVENARSTNVKVAGNLLAGDDGGGTAVHAGGVVNDSACGGECR